MREIIFAVAVAAAVVAAGSASAAPAAYKDPLDTATLTTIEAQFNRLMELANRHDIDAIHAMFWQSPSALLVAKSAIPSEGNWAGYWGNDAIDQKLRDIAASGGVVLTPDLSRLKVTGRTDNWAESYAPVNITVSYAGQDGTPKPFLVIIEWIKVAEEWKIASEILLPVPPPPASLVK
jgi:predicted RNA-binding protein